MGLGEEVGRRRDQQHIGAFYIHREFYVHPGFVLHVFLKTLQGIAQGRFREAQVVADLVQLADDLVRIFLAHADGVHDVARGHGDFRGIDTVGTKHRAAAALGALMKIGVPLVEHVLGHVARADEFGEMLAGEGVVTAIHRAQQVLTRDRHVLRVGGAEIIVTLVGAGAAFHARIQEYLQRARLRHQLAQLHDRDVFPVRHEFARETDAGLVLRFGDERLAVRHRPFPEVGDDLVFAEGGRFEIRHGPIPRATWCCQFPRSSRRPSAARAGCPPGCASG